MKVAFALGVVLLALAYSALPGAFAPLAGTAPHTSFDVNLASVSLALVVLAGAAIGLSAERMKSKEVT